MNSDIQYVGERKTNVLLTLDPGCCILEIFTNTKEGVAVGISYRDVCTKCMLTRQKHQCHVLGRCAIVLCKFRKSNAGLYVATCFIRQCLNMVGVLWRTETKHSGCNYECHDVDIWLHHCFLCEWGARKYQTHNIYFIEAKGTQANRKARKIHFTCDFHSSLTNKWSLQGNNWNKKAFYRWIENSNFQGIRTNEWMA